MQIAQRKTKILKAIIEAYIKNSTVKSTGGNIATKVAGKNDLTIQAYFEDNTIAELIKE